MAPPAGRYLVPDGVDMESAPAQSILTTLFDQPRWLEVHHLYDQRGSELFEAICELPEYYLTRTENAILEASASQIIEAAPVKCIVELGAGYSKKTVHLLTEQVSRRGPSIFAPIDVSISGLLASREAVQRDFPDLQFQGLHAHYEDGFTAVDKNLPTLFVFLGSSIGNFNNTEFARFFRALTSAMGPNDYLLLGADRLKPVDILERAYNDSRGVTAEFILNVFRNTNRLLREQFRSAQGSLPFLVQPRMAPHRNVRPSRGRPGNLFSHRRYRFPLGEGRTNPRRDQPQVRTGAPAGAVALLRSQAGGAFYRCPGMVIGIVAEEILTTAPRLGNCALIVSNFIWL